MSDQFFTQSGTELVCELDEVSYIVKTWKASDKGISAVISLEHEGKILRDDIKLYDKKERDQFAKNHPKPDLVDAHLCRIEDELKHYIHDQANNLQPQKIIEQKVLVEGAIDIAADDNGQPCYLFLDDGVLSEKSSITVNGKMYIPPILDSFTWLLPRASKVIEHYTADNDQLLFKDIDIEIFNNVELPHEHLYSFFAAWIFHSHLISHFKYSPTIILDSDAERGKTRLGTLLINLARCGEMTITLSEANIFRKSERFMASFFFDVTNIWGKAERNGAEDILLGRFERGHSVARIIKPELGTFEDTKHYRVFGPTIIATNEPASHILESRGVVIAMQQSDKNFPDMPSKQDLLPLKERLTAMRARWENKKFEDIEKPAKNRLGDTLKPLKQILSTFAPEKAKSFHKVIEYFEKSKVESKLDTIQGQIVLALHETEKEIFNAGAIEIKKIVERVNLGKNQKYHTTPISVGKRLKAMGFQEGPRTGNDRTILRDDEHYPKLLEKLCREYGVKKSGLSDESDFNSANKSDSYAK